MSEELQSLLEKINSDGVMKANAERDAIIAKAQSEAAAIIAAAEAKAEPKSFEKGKNINKPFLPDRNRKCGEKKR